MALTRPDIWAAVAPVCAATIPGTEELAGNALNFPVRLFQGELDPAVPAESSRQWHRRLLDGGVAVDYTEFPGVRRTSGEFSSDLGEVNIVPFLKSALTDRMLLPMVVFAKADGPAIGRLQTESTISAVAHVSAFDRQPLAFWDRAVVLSHPRPVGRTASRRP